MPVYTSTWAPSLLLVMVGVDMLEAALLELLLGRGSS